MWYYQCSYTCLPTSLLFSAFKCQPAPIFSALLGAPWKDRPSKMSLIEGVHSIKFNWIKFWRYISIFTNLGLHLKSFYFIFWPTPARSHAGHVCPREARAIIPDNFLSFPPLPPPSFHPDFPPPPLFYPLSRQLLPDNLPWNAWLPCFGPSLVLFAPDPTFWVNFGPFSLLSENMRADAGGGYPLPDH